MGPELLIGRKMATGSTAVSASNKVDIYRYILNNICSWRLNGTIVCSTRRSEQIVLQSGVDAMTMKFASARQKVMQYVEG
jgi:hypothetical protein